ncbi:hypothetical protein ABZS76_33005 [Streptomyces sp. NPDC005562]|uniref:hypothetical protein n=1 Tax=Streptomyces sp. NPDC005562 TaxID=3154890 RepID=UPI00339E1906
MSIHFENEPLCRVTLTTSYSAYGGFPQEHHFRLTPDDLAFVLGALHGRKRRTVTGRVEVITALDDARHNALKWYADQVRLSLVQGLGWWRRLLPGRLIERIVEKQMEHYYDTTAQWMAELADLHAQVSGLAGRLPAEGPTLMCGHGGCRRGVPLAPNIVLPPGWTWGKSGPGAPTLPCCPEHPAVSRQMKTAS